MPPRLRRILFLFALAVLLIGGLVYAFRPQPVAVDLAQVTRGPMRVTISEEGFTRVRELYVISAPVTGNLLRVHVHAGDPVAAGETEIASLRPILPGLLDPRSRAQAEAAVSGAQAAQEQAEALLSQAQAELEFARAELRRAETLAARGTVSERQAELARTQLRQAQASVATAEAQLQVRLFELRSAEAALIEGDQAAASGECCIRVTAPIDGQVLRVLRESAGVVAAGTPLVELGDIDDLEVLVELLSREAVRVERGDPVLIEDWGGPALQGFVRRVEPTAFTKISALGVEEQRVRIWIDFNAVDRAQSAGLGHDYRVLVRIVTWAEDEVLRAPLSAIFRQGSGWAAFVAEDGAAILRPIEIGRRNQDVAQILSGLTEGDLLIENPGDTISDGTTIEARHPL